MSGAETEEHRLRRLLFTGDTSPTVFLTGGLPKAGTNNTIRMAAIGGIKKTVLLSVWSLVHPGIGHTALALQHAKAAIKSGLADRRALFLVLSACLKIDCKQTRTATYDILKDLIKSSDDFFEFIYYHKKVFRNKPHGMGRGMRNLVSSWYLSMDPYDLALEVCRVRGRHYWSHHHLIQLARVRTDDQALAAVLSYAVRGYKKTKEMYKHETKAQPILEYLACVTEINKCTDTQQALRLISQHSFDIELVPTSLLREERVWELTLARTPLRAVLSHLRLMTSKGLLHLLNSPVLRLVLCSLRDRLALSSSQLQPSEILGVLTQVEADFKLPHGKHSEFHKKYVPQHSPHPELKKELMKTLEASFSNVAPVGGRVHVAVDTRQCANVSCWGAWDLSCFKAISVTVLSLLHANMDLTLSYFTEDSLGFIEVSTRDEVGSIMEKLKKASEASSRGRVSPEKVLRWNGEERQGQGKELVLCITASDILKEEVTQGIWAQMAQARVNEVEIKFIYWALACKKLEMTVSNENYPNIIDLWGWSPDSTRIIQAFAEDLF